MTEKLLKEFGRKVASAKLVPGDRGAFEVTVNGAMVFSKLDKGRFPDLKELRDALRAATQQP